MAIRDGLCVVEKRYIASLCRHLESPVPYNSLAHIRNDG
jgi:hypothetical protein